MKPVFKVLLCVIIAAAVCYIGAALFASNWNPLVWGESIKQGFLLSTFWGTVILYQVTDDE